MTNYKGYYIDGTVFASKQDVDNFLKDQAVVAYCIAIELFNNNRCLEYSMHCDKCADVLVNDYGYTWEQIENLEIKILEVIA